MQSFIHGTRQSPHQSNEVFSPTPPLPILQIISQLTSFSQFPIFSASHLFPLSPLAKKTRILGIVSYNNLIIFPMSFLGVGSNLLKRLFPGVAMTTARRYKKRPLCQQYQEEGELNRNRILFFSIFSSWPAVFFAGPRKKKNLPWKLAATNGFKVQ